MKTLKALLFIAQWLFIALVLSTCSEPEQPRPEITNISPNQGSVGSEVIITGKNFSTAESVMFGIVSQSFASKTDTEIRTVVPSGLDPGNLSVTVKSDGGTSNGVSFTVLPSEPEITSIEPNKGAVGMVIAIKGKHLASASSVSIGDLTVTTFISKSDSEVPLTIPEGLDPGALDVTITTGGGTSAKATFTIVGKPVINSIAPISGPEGKVVTITGIYFDDASKVFFGVIEAEFEVKSSSVLEAIVPPGAATGKIKVVTPGGEAISAEDFVVKGAPEIISFSPANGIVGALITIIGKNFDGGNLTVKFGTGDATDITIVNATQLTAKVPSTATTGKITVETLAGSGLSLTDFVVIGPPVISSLSPARGGTGVEVVISGNNFINVSSVRFNTTTVSAGNYSVISHSEIKVKVPAGATSGKVSITTAAGTGNSPENFTILPSPTITSFTPTTGPAGRKVSITGTHFEEATKVFFGIGEAPFDIKSVTLIEATVPVTASTGKVKVVTPGGEASSTENFILRDAPEITNFTPTSGIVGTVITINGQNFDAGAAAVKFGTGSATEVTVVSATQITAKVSLVATTGKITVETAAGSVLSAANFTVIGAPSVASFSPVSGAIGIEVVIAGSNFVNVNDVKFNNTTVSAANYSIVSATQIKAKVPSGAASGKISVTTPAGTGNSANNFIVFLPPTITSFIPIIGPAGTKVSVTGTNYDGATKVFFGTVEAVFEIKSTTSIEATVPIGAVTGKIKITAPGGEATSTADFVVKDPPEITTFSPSSAIVGALVTITGNNFDAGGVVVKFGTGIATSITVVSPTQITATVPATATTGKITVETAAGSVLSAANFTVIGLPTVTSFTPASGGTGVEVTITGTNFINVSSVRLNTTEVSAANYTVVSPTQVKANVPAGATLGKISVTTPAGTGTSATDFIILFPPSIASFSLANGAPGSNVVITGTGFVNVSSVLFNEIAVGAANFTVNSSTQITATVPGNATSGKIKVINPQGTATSVNTFYVTPFITSITPSATSAGSSITISGTNLEGATVRFGATGVTPTSNTSNTITVLVPTNINGGVNVTVVNLGGTSNSRTLTVTPPVVVDEVVATANIVGQLILFKGSNLTGATRVLFGATEADVLTNTSIVVTAIIPASLAVGAYTVSVETSNGTSNGRQFEVLSSQHTNTGGVSMVNGATVISLPAGYVPPISNQWQNDFQPDEKFLIDESDGSVVFSINFIDVASGTGIFDKVNNYVEFTLDGVRYVGVWTPRTSFDNGIEIVCFDHMTLISTESGMQLELSVPSFDECP